MIDIYTNLEVNKFYSAIEGESFDLVTSIQPHKVDNPMKFNLFQNYTNPFNPSTEISFSLFAPSYIQLRVYDIKGRDVITLADGIFQNGTHNILFNAEDLCSGIYLYKLKVENSTAVKKMVLLN